MRDLNPTSFAEAFPALAAELSSEELRVLLDELIVQDLEASEALIAENTVSDALFLVWDGELDVWMTAAGEGYRVAKVRPGELLGEVSLMDPGLATATVRTEEGCTALHLGRAQLDGLSQSHPHLVSVFLRLLARTVAARIRSAGKYLDQLLTGEETPVARSAPASVAVHTRLYQAQAER